jgi:hypothetical protein
VAGDFNFAAEDILYGEKGAIWHPVFKVADAQIERFSGWPGESGPKYIKSS